MYFLRLHPELGAAVTMNNIRDEVSSGVLTNDILASLSLLLVEIYAPAIESQEAESSGKRLEDLLVNIAGFANNIQEANNSMKYGMIVVTPRIREWCHEQLESGYTTPQQLARRNEGMVPSVKAEILSWCDHIHSFIDVAHEQDEITQQSGPLSEIVHWKGQLAMASMLLEQLQADSTKPMMDLLSYSEPPAAKHFNELLSELNECCNEAKDNVKFLQTIDKFATPLYHGTPIDAAETMPGFLNAIQIIYTISRYYNTPQSIELLLVKINQQMVTCCKLYVLNGEHNLFRSTPTDVIARIEQCLSFNETYHKQYHHAKAELLQNPMQKQWDFDDKVILGKLDEFCDQLAKVETIFDFLKRYSQMANSGFAHFESIVSHSKEVQEYILGRGKFALELRDFEFERYLSDIQEHTLALDHALLVYINGFFKNMSNTTEMLNILADLQHCCNSHQTPSFITDELINKFHEALTQYGEDLKHIEALYFDQHKNPPLARDFPQVAGSIAWARNLRSHVEEPMKIFMRHGDHINRGESKPLVRKYNKLVRALLAYEAQWHDAWSETLTLSHDGFNATLLVEHDDAIHVNFDPQINELIRETKALHRLGLPIPAVAVTLVQQEDSMKLNTSKTRDLTRKFHDVLKKIPPRLMDIMEPHLVNLRESIEPGLTHLTWSSLSIHGYLYGANKTIDKIDVILDKARDILDCRIDRNLKTAMKARLAQLPDNLVTVDQFMDMTRKLIETRVPELNMAIRNVEMAVSDLVSTVTSAYDSTQQVSVSAAVEELQAHYKLLCFRSVRTTVIESLTLLKERFAPPKGLNFIAPDPIFLVGMELVPPEVHMNPNLEEIQICINQVAKSIVTATKGINAWECETGNRASYFEPVAKDKQVAKTLLLLTGSLLGLNMRVLSFIDLFNEFHFLWEENLDNKRSSFLNKRPTLDDIEHEITGLEQVENEINKFAKTNVVGSLSLTTTELIASLHSVLIRWKNMYAHIIREREQRMLTILSSELTQASHRLHLTVESVDDLSAAVEVIQSLRQLEGDFEYRMMPIVQHQGILQEHGLNMVHLDESITLDDLQAQWKQVKQSSLEAQDNIMEVQSHFKQELLKAVEDFCGKVSVFYRVYEQSGPSVPDLLPRVASERLKKFKTDFREMEMLWKSYEHSEQLFGLPLTKYPELVAIKNELALLSILYDLYTDVITVVESFGDSLWSYLDLDSFQAKLTEFQNSCKKMPKQMKLWTAFTEVKTRVNSFDELMPLLHLMMHKSLRERHWHAITQICGMKEPLNRNADVFRLQHVLSLNVSKYKDEIEDVCVEAQKQAELENKLVKIRSDWTDKAFHFEDYKGHLEASLHPKDTADLIQVLDESQTVLLAMAGNRYNAPFKSSVQAWIQKLATVSELVDLWLNVQFLWQYLEAVFAGGDIAKQLPQEARRFAQIDKAWMKIMENASEQTNILKLCCGDETLGNVLPSLLEQLEVCQRHLGGYLEGKRALFPRFYFVSDNVLLEILGRGTDPQTVQMHMLTIFTGVKSVVFDTSGKTTTKKIKAVASAEGELIPLESLVVPEGSVEGWLTKLEKEIQVSINGIVERGAIEVMDTHHLEQFVDDFPAQVAVLCLQILWTIQCEDAMVKAKAGDRNVMALNNKKVSGVLKQLVSRTGQDLSILDRKKTENLITIQIHQKDIIADLYSKRIKDPYHFEWQKQMRSYWNVTRTNCTICVTDVNFVYNCEYQGCVDRLVITPLTDRCYITLAQALSMCLGGAPTGPAGTGKTETVKDMAGALGNLVVVSNCSDQMDRNSLGRIFKGLAHAGAWGCFDEFNRISLPVLSVVAQQVSCILNAKRRGDSDFVFVDGHQVSLDPTCGFFITMNPGYAGRQELPANLKVLFRSVAMMVPDRELIMRVKLAAAGFLQEVSLAHKFHILYKLCEQQLSKQRHYDFGLRNILSVLRSCGTAKRAAKPDQKEVEILFRVLRDMNISKLVDTDNAVFQMLLADLFPKLSVIKAEYPGLENSIIERAELSKLVLTPRWELKLIQLYETTLVRHGVILMGEPGSGKSTAIRFLQEALTNAGQPHKMVAMNPKAITASQMFGSLNPQTNEWIDGVFAALWRYAVESEGHNMWICLDGPVDANWIENLNTVLDDNKLLTLANGDRIRMAPTMKLVFEVENLKNASPATVSRAGVVNMSYTCLGWRSIVEVWAATRPVQEKEYFEKLFNEYGQGVIDFASSQPQVAMMNELCGIANCVTLLTCLLPKHEKRASVSLEVPHMERLFVFAVMWSLLGMVPEQMRVHLFLVKLGFELPELMEVMPGVVNTVYEHFINDKGAWESWNELVPEFDFPEPDTSFSEIFVPTIESTRANVMMTHLADVCPVLLIGEAGSSKTRLMQRYVASKESIERGSTVINFSSATTPFSFQRGFESLIDRRLGKTYGPAAGKLLTVFIDDINMPHVNEWGDQPTNEFTRQLIEGNTFFDIDEPGKRKYIVDMSYMAAMQLPKGGRNDIPDRLKRHFFSLHIPLPSSMSIEHIYSVLFRCHFSKINGFDEEIYQSMGELCDATFRIWTVAREKFLPTPTKFHYIFNMRDLSRITQGLLQCTAAKVERKTDLYRLWSHECSRVLADRLVSEDDNVLYEHECSEIVDDIAGTSISLLLNQTFHFVDFMKVLQQEGDGEDISYSYDCVKSIDDVRHVIVDFMAKYNNEIKGARLDLVMFDVAVDHVCRICRILSLPGGSALLIGLGGSGKQSLTRLAAFIRKQQVITLPSSKCSAPVLLEELRELYKRAGCGEDITLLMTETDVKADYYLDYINMLLTSGEVPGLMPKDELEMAMAELQSNTAVSKTTSLDPRQAFFNNAHSKLHIVLCFSPASASLQDWVRRFPGIINGCTIDWHQPWPKEAFLDIATVFVDEMELKLDDELKPTKKELQARLVEFLSSAHLESSFYASNFFASFRRHVYVTPKIFLDYLTTYKKIYVERAEKIESHVHDLTSGLQKLNKAAEDVQVMKTELVAKEEKLAIAQGECEIQLKEVSARTSEATKRKAKVQLEKDTCAAAAKDVGGRKEETEHELEHALPVLNAAKEALNKINAGEINTLKKMGKPPNLVRRVLDGVLLLRQSPMDPVEFEGEYVKPSWKSALKLMGDMNFLNILETFEKDGITDETCELLEPYLEMEDFNFEKVKGSSGSAAGLCAWARAMIEYHHIALWIEPKQTALQIALTELELAERKVRAAESELLIREAELHEMKSKLDQAIAVRTALKEDADVTRMTMSKANQLIDGLVGERQRWTEDIKECEKQIVALIGDVGVAAAFLSYSGPLNQTYRNKMNDVWNVGLQSQSIPSSLPDLDVRKFLVPDTTMDIWTNLESLPSDVLSVESAAITVLGVRSPFLIDPQGQGKRWLCTREETNSLIVTSQSSQHFKQLLEDAIQDGRPLLIEDVETWIDPVLDTVFGKVLIASGTGLVMPIGDKQVPYHKDFKFFLTTKLPNPHLRPELFAQTSIIDFTVTLEGLESQLLSRVIRREKSDLEATRQNLLRGMTENKQLVDKLEIELLHLLSSKANLLEDSSLLEVLNHTKNTIESMGTKIRQSEDTQKNIAEACEHYRAVAAYGSNYFFLVSEMSMIQHMYSISLTQFLRKFDESMRMAVPSQNVVARVESVTSTLTSVMYKFVTRGLFNNHKTLFVLQMALRLDTMAGEFAKEEMNLLLRGGLIQPNPGEAKPLQWLPDEPWKNLMAFAKIIPKFASIVEDMKQAEFEWAAWFASPAPEAEELPPLGYHDFISPVHRFLLIRCLRIDRMMAAATVYINSTLGKEFTEPAQLNLYEAWGESDGQMPILFLLSSGADPTSEIEALARRMKVTMPPPISLGQGQEIPAQNLVMACMADGGWVLLQNCHLGLEFLSELEATVLDSVDTDESFRLWLTTDVTPDFPINLLQASLKITTEVPRGLKAGLKRSFDWLNIDLIEQVNSQQWRPLLYTMCFLHTTVQERLKFGSLGWNIPYDFNQSDLTTSVQFLSNYLSMETSKVSWPSIRYMICEVIYGGRVTDKFDSILLKTFGEAWLDVGMTDSEFSFADGYRMPDVRTVEDYRRNADAIPPKESPEVYGLHVNAELKYWTDQATSILKEILTVQPRDTSSVEANQDEVVSRRCREISEKLPANFTEGEIQDGEPRGPPSQSDTGGLKPLNIFLQQELRRIQTVLNQVRADVKMLQMAMQGNMMMTDALTEASDALFVLDIPQPWLRKSFPGSGLWSWLDDLVGRVKQLGAWLHEGRPNIMYPGKLFNPAGLLTCMMQEMAQQNTWALDSVHMTTEVTSKMASQVHARPAEGLYVGGLYIEGANFDMSQQMLIDCPMSNRSLLSEMPVIHVSATSSGGSLAHDSRFYNCPVYQRPARSVDNYVFSINLRSNEAVPDKWVMRGVAVLCSIIG